MPMLSAIRENLNFKKQGVTKFPLTEIANYCHIMVVAVDNVTKTRDASNTILQFSFSFFLLFTFEVVLENFLENRPITWNLWSRPGTTLAFFASNFVGNRKRTHEKACRNNSTIELDFKFRLKINEPHADFNFVDWRFCARCPKVPPTLQNFKFKPAHNRSFVLRHLVTRT